MNILALDLASKLGWAHSDGSSGIATIKAKKPGTHNGPRYEHYATWLADTLSKHPADAIVYEQAHHRGGAATRWALGLIAVTELVATKQGIETVKPYHSATIKKHATNNGRADKAEMLKAAKVRNPDMEFLSDDHVDALFVLDLALNDRDLLPLTRLMGAQ